MIRSAELSASSWERLGLKSQGATGPSINSLGSPSPNINPASSEWTGLILATTRGRSDADKTPLNISSRDPTRQ
jgi:hypothetical protein